MAELDTSEEGGGKKGKVRSKKQSTRVDLTAMVDLAFLLITFFMLTTTLAKPQAMDLAMPDKTDNKDEQTELATKASKTLTILLGNDNTIVYYMGVLGDNPPEKTLFGDGSIRKFLISKNREILARDRSEKNKGLIVIIKPSEKSVYKNFVDILDEVKISGVQSYAVVDITDKEVDVLKEQNAY